jgi:DNA-binding XRE family transcriptional regulator
MTQEEAANFLNITTRHYRQLESGDSDGSVKIWEQLSHRFDTSINDLLSQGVGVEQPDYINSISVGIGEAKELESAMKSFGLDVDSIIDIAQDGRLDEPARRETAERLAKVLVAVLSGKSAA